MKKLNKKKGFTLIELLAVIVILAILMLVAGTNVFNLLGTARKGSFRTEFLGMLESAQTQVQTDMMFGKTGLNKAGDSVCYCVGDGCASNQLSLFDNKNNYTGSVQVTLKEDGTLDLLGWLSSASFKAENIGRDVAEDNIVDRGAAAASQKCGK